MGLTRITNQARPTVDSDKLPSGSVIQVKHATTTGGSSNGVTVTNGNYADIVTLTITPKSSTSIIIVHCIGGLESLTGGTNKGSRMRLVKGSTAVSTQSYNNYLSSLNAQNIHVAGLQYVDDHDTTSSITYKLQVGAYSQNARGNQYADSTIIAYEVAQ